MFIWLLTTHGAVLLQVCIPCYSHSLYSNTKCGTRYKHSVSWNYHLTAELLHLITIALIALSSSFLDREKLFCSSQYFIEAVKKPTMYCSITGKYILRGKFS